MIDLGKNRRESSNAWAFVFISSWFSHNMVKGQGGQVSFDSERGDPLV